MPREPSVMRHKTVRAKRLNSSMGRDAYLEKIPAELKQSIFDMANDEWVDRLDEATKKDEAKYTALSEQMYQRRVTFLATTSTPALELHCFADHWNWGGGVEAMRQVAEHPGVRTQSITCSSRLGMGSRSTTGMVSI
jgi:hypothetical protein